MNRATPRYTFSSYSLSLPLIVSHNQGHGTLVTRRRATHILKIVRVTPDVISCNPMRCEV
jgi:hypothetical protein